MKIKNSMRYHLILVRIAIVKKERETSVGENVEKSEALLTVGRKEEMYFAALYNEEPKGL